MLAHAVSFNAFILLRHIPSSQIKSETAILRVWSSSCSFGYSRRRSCDSVNKRGNIIGRIMMAARSTNIQSMDPASVWFSAALGSRQCRHVDTELQSNRNFVPFRDLFGQWETKVKNSGVQVCGYVAASDMTACAASRIPAVFMRISVTSLVLRSWWLPIPRLLRILG